MEKGEFSFGEAQSRLQGKLVSGEHSMHILIMF